MKTMKTLIAALAALFLFASPSFATHADADDPGVPHSNDRGFNDGRDRGADQDDLNADPTEPNNPPDPEPPQNDGRGDCGDCDQR